MKRFCYVGLNLKAVENGYLLSEYNSDYAAKSRDWFAATLEDACEIIKQNPPHTFEVEDNKEA